MDRSPAVLLVVVLAVLIGAPAYASVKALVDSDQVASGDTIELVLSHDGQTNSKPDLTPLEQDFDVVSTSSSSNVQIMNGSYSAQTQLRLTLAPKRSGQLTIPSLTWDKDKSSPISVTVGGSGNAQAGAAQTQSANVFLKSTVDTSQPYVQGAVNLTVRLYAAVPLYRAGLELPASSDVLVQQLGKDRNSETEVNGRRYAMVERHYLLFPQHSGAIKVPGAVLNAQVAVRARSDPSDDPFSSFFGRSPLADMMQTTKPVRIHADDIALNVQPRPASATASYWIPAKKLDVTSQWHPDTLEVHAGEPVTLDIHLSATGLTAAQLPDVASLLQLPPGLKAYPDQPKLDNSEQDGTIVGTHDQSVALIADQPGTFTLPAIRIQWWDTGADQLREAELPGRTLKVLAAAGGSSVANAPRSDVAPNVVPQRGGSNAAPTQSAVPAASPWQWVSLALGVLWVGTLIAWWLSRRRVVSVPIASHASPTVNASESEARGQFLVASKANDAITARRALLEWARAKWPGSPPVGLRALANRLGDAQIESLLIELDRACFAQGEWNGSVLAQAINRLPPTRVEKKERQEELMALYP